MGICTNTYVTLTAAQVPQGFAAEEPKKYVLDDEEYERISKLAQLQLEDVREDEPETLKTKKAVYCSQVCLFLI